MLSIYESILRKLETKYRVEKVDGYGTNRRDTMNCKDTKSKKVDIVSLLLSWIE